MKETQDAKEDSAPTIWAVGGGKGGAGKSVVSTMLSCCLARMGKRTVLIDVDLGGANIHTLMGIKSPPRSINDFITRKFKSLKDICIDTEEKNLRLISGSSEVLSLANPHFSQKIKLINHFARLNTDNLVLDLGAGTSFNVLDFFLAADEKIVVLTPEPTSIQNAYIFVRNVVYRRLSRLTNKDSSLKALVKIAMNPKNEFKIRTIKELFQFIQESGGKDVAAPLEKEIGKIRPAIITNMVKESKEKKANRIIQIVAERYLSIQSVALGSVEYDRQIFEMISDMIPLIQIDPSSPAFSNIYAITTKLLKHQV
ncbi:MAG: P-loop NTPase [Desulfobacterales bacterium]